MTSWIEGKLNFFICIIVFCISIIFLTSTPSISADVSLSWDANNPSADGYLLFMKPENGSYDYTSPVWSGVETACTIDELSNGTYYFVVRAYSGDAESTDSNEVKVVISDDSLSSDCDVDGLDLAGFVGGNSDLKLDILVAGFGSVACQ